MHSLIISFFSGYLISLLGSIAPSNVSATAMALSMEKNRKAGMLFGLGSAIVEAIYIRLYFLGFDMFLKQGILFLILQWTMLLIFLVIGLIIFIRYGKKQLARNEARKPKDYSKCSLTRAFFMGVVLKAINPMQFVFWTFWSSYLISNNWLQPTSAHYNIFCIALGLATYTGFLLYVYLGEYLSSRSFFSKNSFRRLIGGFLCVTSIVWAIKLVFEQVPY